MIANRKPQHIDTLDFLRGIAALAVCFFHFAYANDYLAKGNILRTTSSFGYLGVDVFFVISGFIIPYSMYLKDYNISKFNRYITKRFVRIEPPYFMAILLVLALKFIVTQTSYYKGIPFSVNWPQLFSHFAYLTSFLSYDWLSPVFWTLSIEFQYYLLMAIIFPLLTSSNQALKIGIIVLLIATSTVSSENVVFHYIPLFMLGIGLFLYKNGMLGRTFFLLIIIFSVTIGYSVLGLAVMMAGLGSFFAINFVKIRTKTGKLLGDLSYSLYLIHSLIGATLISVTSKFVKDDLARSALVFIFVGAAILSSYLFYRCCERPFLAMSKRIQY